MKLKGQTVLVTGGSRGIGRAICLALAKEGADLVIASRNEREMKETAEMVKKAGSRALYVRTDVRKEADVQNLISKAIETFGKLDILINNAGVAYKKPLEETSLEEYEEIMDTNIKGTFLCTKYALPHMLKSRESKLINISSGAGKQGIPELSVYCASKFAVNGFSESLASELRGRLRVYTVCPGGVDTQMYRFLFSDEPFLKPEHVAKEILDLCMPDSRAPSGATIEVYRPPVPLL